MTIIISIALLCALLTAAGTVVAGELPRRTYLGLQFDLEDRSGPGLMVADVLPESTAKMAGMRAGDRLTSVGRIDSLASFPELRDELARTPAGQRIALRWYRGPNRVHRVSPPLGTLPMESVPESLVRYDQVEVDDIAQRLIVSEPVAGAKALVLFLQGIGCGSHDYWFDTDSPVKMIIDGWARAGYATARLEKRGVGDSGGPDCGALSFADERRGYLAAVTQLAAQGFAGRIFLFGHSLGGIIAPLVATNAVAGVMVYGTVSVPWYDYMMSNFERQDRLAGIGGEVLADRQRLRAEFQKGLLFEGEAPGVLKAKIPGVAVLEDVQLADDEHYYERSVEFFTELAVVNPERAWRQVWQPVLAVHGEFDWVSDKADHERIARLSGGKFLSAGGLDHGFLHYGSLKESYQAQGAGEFDPVIIEATIAWMTAIPITPASLTDGAGPTGF